MSRANIAAENGDFDEAVHYFRLAAQKAPMRTDVRNSLFSAIEKQKARKNSTAGPVPMRKPTQPPLFDNPSHDENASAMIEEVAPVRKQTALRPATPAAPRPPHTPRRAPTETQELFGPGDFSGGRENRPASHQRPAPASSAPHPADRAARRMGDGRQASARPRMSGFAPPRPRGMSMIRIGVTLALSVMVLGGAAAGILFLMKIAGGSDDKASTSALSGAERQDNELVARAEEYLAERLYSLAIEQIEMMSAGSRRSAMLAKTFASQAGEFFSGQRYEEARRVYDKAAEAEPENDLWAFHSGWCSYMMGIEKRKTNRQAAQDLFDAAEVSFKTAIRINPNQVKALHGLGKIEVARNNRPAANEYYQKVLQIAPDSPEAGMARGDLQAWGLERPQTQSPPAAITTAANISAVNTTTTSAPPAEKPAPAPAAPKEEPAPARKPKVKTEMTALKTKL